MLSNNKIKKEHIYGHREIKSKEIIALHIRESKRSFINNPIIYTDKGTWYIWPMKFLKIKHRKKTFG